MRDSQLYCPKLAELECHPGEYMCYYKIPEPTQTVLLLCWAPEAFPIQSVESELGALEWLGLLKSRFNRMDTQCSLEVVGQFSLVMVKSAESRVLLKVVVLPELVIEGGRDAGSGFMEMVKEGDVHYCVVKMIIGREEIVFDPQMQMLNE
jgi:hypothetical protein